MGITNLSGLETAKRLRFLDLSDNGLTSISLPGRFTELTRLELSDNAITTLTPDVLADTPNLSTLILDRNLIRDLSELVGITIVDNGDLGYSETGTWQSEVTTVEDAWRDDYRFSKNGGEATYAFDVVNDELFDLLVTWPTLDDLSAAGTEAIIRDGENVLATVPLLQSAPAGATETDAEFAGRPWMSLGRFAATSGQLSVTLVGVDGLIVAADAVRAERAVPTPLSLNLLSLLGNPLDDVTRDASVDRLTQRGVDVFVTPQVIPPEIAPVDGLTLQRGRDSGGQAEMSDARLSGDVVLRDNADRWCPEACSPELMSDLLWGTIEVTNDDGSWVGTSVGTTDASAGGAGVTYYELVGAGAYDGLSAILFESETEEGFLWNGVIFPGDLPPDR